MQIVKKCPEYIRKLFCQGLNDKQSTLKDLVNNRLFDRNLLGIILDMAHTKDFVVKKFPLRQMVSYNNHLYTLLDGGKIISIYDTSGPIFSCIQNICFTERITSFYIFDSKIYTVNFRMSEVTIRNLSGDFIGKITGTRQPEFVKVDSKFIYVHHNSLYTISVYDHSCKNIVNIHYKYFVHDFQVENGIFYIYSNQRKIMEHDINGNILREFFLFDIANFAGSMSLTEKYVVFSSGEFIYFMNRKSGEIVKKLSHVCSEKFFLGTLLCYTNKKIFAASYGNLFVLHV